MLLYSQNLSKWDQVYAGSIKCIVTSISIANTVCSKPNYKTQLMHAGWFLATYLSLVSRCNSQSAASKEAADPPPYDLYSSSPSEKYTHKLVLNSLYSSV